MDTERIQEGTVPIEGAVSSSGETTKVTETTKVVEPTEGSKGLTPEMEAKVQQMIAEATVRAVQEAKEVGKRELQSAQDKNKAELTRAQRRAEGAERTLTATRSHLLTVDPETAKEFELAELREKERGRTVEEQEETLVRQQAEFHQGFIDRQTRFITDLGIDPKDKRIDWAGDAPNYLDAMARIQTSVATIQKANVQTLQSGLETRLRDLEAKVSKVNIEANSVETGASQGAVAGSDVDFVKKFASNDLPMTKANIDRYNKILEQS